MGQEYIKFTEEELNALRNIRDEFSNKFFRLGQNKMAITELKMKLKELKGVENGIVNDVNSLKDIQNDLNRQLTEKYGQGNLDIETGIFEKFKEQE